jgi:hypothetical protein
MVLTQEAAEDGEDVCHGETEHQHSKLAIPKLGASVRGARGAN